MLFLLCSAQAVSDSPRVPPPTGAYPVGTFVIRLVDSGRKDPYLRDGSKRELMVRLWYPAERNSQCVPAEYNSPKVRGLLSVMLGFSAPRVQTNSCWEAPVLAGAHPVVVVSHGYTGMFTDLTFLCEDLASHGYVVVSIGHTYESTAVEFPGGDLRTSHVGSLFVEQTLQTDESTLREAMAVRLADVRFVVGELARLNAGTGVLSGRLNLERMGILGHSMGASTAMQALQQNVGFRAAVLMDAIEISGPPGAAIQQSVLMVAEGRGWSESECNLWNQLRGPRMAIAFRGAEHLTPTDAVWMGTVIPELHVEAGLMGPAKTIAALRQAVSTFFQLHLGPQSGDRWPNGFGSAYPDAIETSQNQRLCSSPAHLSKSVP
jgi:dienelactone hydrolase